MRTTLTLDPDVAARAKKAAAKPYCTVPRPLGLRRGFRYDNIAELLAQGEGEDIHDPDRANLLQSRKPAR